MKTKHAAILDFQKKLILSANQQTRVDALNIFRIVAENLREFVQLRLPEEPKEKILDNMDTLTEVYRMWGNALIRRFPTLADFEPFMYEGCSHVMVIDCDKPEPARLIKGENLTGSDEEEFQKHKNLATSRDSSDFAQAVADACEWAKKANKSVSIVHYWLNTSAIYNMDDPTASAEEEYFGDDILIATPIYNENNQDIFTFYWRYKFLPDFANPELFSAILTYLDGGDYQGTLSSHCQEYPDAYAETMRMPASVISDPDNPEIMLRTPLYLLQEDGSEKIISPLDAFKLRCDVDNADEVWMTVYRTDKDPMDPYTYFIITTAERLKSKFHIYMELMARGDSGNNVELFNKLKDIGADVKCRQPKKKDHLKVHAKILLARVPENNGNQFTFTRMVSTGNFNTNASKTYRDTFFINSKTVKKDQGLLDAYPITAEMFQELFGNVYEGDMEDRFRKIPPVEQELDITFSPNGLRNTITHLIHTAIQHKEDYSVCLPFLWIKVNNITEKNTIALLLEAVRAGVEVRIITRSSCSIPTQISYPNLQIVSVSGKYLEHDRFFIYGEYIDGQAASKSILGYKVNAAYIMSADLMKRNLYKRIEMMCRMPDYEAGALAELFDNIFSTASLPNFGYFRFFLTPSCWVSLDKESLATLMPVQYSDESGYYMLGDEEEQIALKPSADFGNVEFANELMDLYEKYGRIAYGAADYLSHSPQLQDPQRKYDRMSKVIFKGLEEISGGLLLSPEDVEASTAMTPEDMDSVIGRVRRVRILKYLNDIGCTNLDAQIAVVHSIMDGTTSEQQEMYVNNLRVLAESNIGAGFFDNEKEVREFMEKVTKDKMDKTYTAPVQMKSGIILPELPESEKSDDSEDEESGNTQEPEQFDPANETPTEHEILQKFWTICDVPYGEIDKVLTDKGINYADFICKVIPKFGKVVWLSENITLDEVAGWIDSYKFQNELDEIDRAGGPLKYACLESIKQELRQKLQPLDSTLGEELKRLNIGTDTFNGFLREYKDRIHAAQTISIKSLIDDVIRYDKRTSEKAKVENEFFITFMDSDNTGTTGALWNKLSAPFTQLYEIADRRHLSATDLIKIVQKHSKEIADAESISIPVIYTWIVAESISADDDDGVDADEPDDSEDDNGNLE